MMRFMTRSAKSARSLLHHANLSRLDHSSGNASQLPDTPSTEGLSRPWTHEQVLKASRSTCTETLDERAPFDCEMQQCGRPEQTRAKVCA